MAKVDVPTTAVRSALMKRVRQRGTTPELLVRRILSSVGIRYRVNVRSLPGRPDIASRRARKAIFVHGCFWHHHTACGRGTVPASNRAFWKEKLRANVERDARKVEALKREGFDVTVVWECELSDPSPLAERLLAFWERDTQEPRV